MAHHLVILVTLAFVFDTIVEPGQRMAHGLARAEQWKCADVMQNPKEVDRELVLRNLNRNKDHKIIKFIENCIKSEDGWRFKKSGAERIISSLLNYKNNNNPLPLEYFPTLSRDSSSQSFQTIEPNSNNDNNPNENSGHYRRFFSPMYFARLAPALLASQHAEDNSASIMGGDQSSESNPIPQPAEQPQQQPKSASSSTSLNLF